MADGSESVRPPDVMDASRPATSGTAGLQPADRGRGYTTTDRVLISLVFAAVLPFVAVKFLGIGGSAAIAMAVTSGIAIVAAAFALSWATEGLETVVPVSIAIALLALIEVAPEYSFEALLAYRQQTELAAASMTGANRLLLGAGWPLLTIVAWGAARRQRRAFDGIPIGRDQLIVLRSLLLATIYGFVIALKGSISLFDAGVLIIIYVVSIYHGLRAGNHEDSGEKQEGDAIGVGGRTKALPIRLRAVAIAACMSFGAVSLFFAAEPFIDSVLVVAGDVGVSQFVLIQWVAPFLSEFPESLTAYLWAATLVQAPKGLSNLMSSKLNQWTLLIATIPIAYSIGAGHTAALPLGARSVEEIFLTGAQTLFAVALALRLRFRLREAAALLGLFGVQFVIISENVRLVLGWVYIVLAVVLFALRWRALAALITGRSADAWPA